MNVWQLSGLQEEGLNVREWGAKQTSTDGSYSVAFWTKLNIADGR